MNFLLAWFIISPVLIAGLLFLFKRYILDFGFLILLTFSSFNCLLTIFVYKEIYRTGHIIYRIGNWSAINGIVLLADKFSIFILLIVQILFLAALFFSKGYVQEKQIKYFSFFYLLQAGLAGMTLTTDLFNMFVFLEIVSLVSYALVTYEKDDVAFEAGFKYIIIGSVASLIIFWGIGVVYAVNHNLNLALIGESFDQVSQVVKAAIFIAFFVGFSIKFSLFPFHPLAPDAYSSAPSPISAILSGIVGKVQIYSLIRIYISLFNIEYLHQYNFDNIIILLGGLTVLVGHLMAIKQTNLKRLLAYSSIAHMGYIVIGIGCISAKSIIGALYHMVNHGILKAGLFFIAGSLIYKLNIKEIADLKGLYYRNRYLGVLFFLLSLGMIGIPPLNGSLSKWLIIMGAMSSENYLSASIVALGTLLAVIYYMRINLLIFTRVSVEKFDIDFLFFLPIVSMVILSLVLFFYGNSVYPILNDILETLTNNSGYIKAILNS